jgi:uncharacterized protein (DUF4415 family)
LRAKQERAKSICKVHVMKEEYDFSKSIKNPYEKHLMQQITLHLDIDVISYFKELADETGVPYQNLINLYLRDCAVSHKKLKLNWISSPNSKKTDNDLDI